MEEHNEQAARRLALYHKVSAILIVLLCALVFLYSDLVDDNLSLIEKQRDLIDELSRSLATKEVVRDTVVVATKPVVKRVVVRDTVRDTVVVAAKPVVKRVVVRDTVRDTVLIPTAQTAARAELGRRGIAYTGNAFHDAARAGNLEVVRLFVMAGMSLEAYDLLRFTALHLAAANGHLEVVKFLVGAGARVTATTVNGRTARDWAARGGHRDIANYLRSVGG